MRSAGIRPVTPELKLVASDPLGSPWGFESEGRPASPSAVLDGARPTSVSWCAWTGRFSAPPCARRPARRRRWGPWPSPSGRATSGAGRYHETAAAAGEAALSACGAACSVVLAFERCGAYAADPDAGTTAVGWAESSGSADGARRAALSAYGSRGGTGCVAGVWGCNGPVVEEGLGLDRATRREIQQGLEAAGFDLGGADGLFGPRTRSAIRRWQSSRGGRATGYLDDASAAALRPGGVPVPVEAVVAQEAAGATPAPADPFAALEQAFASERDAEGSVDREVADAVPEDPFAALGRAFASEAAESSASAETVGVGGAEAVTPDPFAALEQALAAETLAEPTEEDGPDIEAAEPVDFAEWTRAVNAGVAAAEQAAAEAEAAASGAGATRVRTAACVSAREHLTPALSRVEDLTVGDEARPRT